jgi:hypothetical protein
MVKSTKEPSPSVIDILPEIFHMEGQLIQPSCGGYRNTCFHYLPYKDGVISFEDLFHNLAFHKCGETFKDRGTCTSHFVRDSAYTFFFYLCGLKEKECLIFLALSKKV